MFRFLNLLLFAGLSIIILNACGQQRPLQENTNQVVSPLVTSPLAIPIALPAEDFGFVFDYKPCHSERLDTFAQTFTYTGVDPAITLPITLTSAEMMRIYQEMVSIDFFAYPSVFSIPPASNGQITETVPATAYYFMVRNNGQVQMINWVDSITPETPYPEADRLRELADLIIQTVKQRSEVQQLPASEFACL